NHNQRGSLIRAGFCTVITRALPGCCLEQESPYETCMSTDVLEHMLSEALKSVFGVVAASPSVCNRNALGSPPVFHPKIAGSFGWSSFASVGNSRNRGN